MNGRQHKTNILIYMKQILILLSFFSFCLMETLQAQEGKVTIHMDQVSVRDVLTALEKQTHYTFLYKNEMLKNKTAVTIHADNKELSTVLNEVLSSRGLSYTMDDNVIIIQARRAVAATRSPSSEIFITGNVQDEDREPLTGSTIALKGTTKAVVADMDGNYRIGVPEQGAVLVFSFVGMQPKEVAVGKESVVNVILNYSSIMLDDVEVVGAYGSIQKRSDMVGSAFQVNSEQIKTLPVSRVDLLLEGKMPGVNININTDDASSTRPRYFTRVRGSASLTASNEPFYVVDGTPVFTGERTNQVLGMSTSISPLSYLNPEDIESITVLKDAAAVSIYGANASNGVILITTKRGRAEQKPRLTVSARYGISEINKGTLFKVLNTSEYMMLAKESYANNTELNPALFPYQDNELNSYSTTSTNWTDAFYDKGFSFFTNLSISGGSKNTTYYVSGSYYNSDLTIMGNNQKRISLRGRIESKLHDKFTVNLSLSSSYNINTLFNPDSDYYDLLPIYSPYNSDGTFRIYNKSLKAVDEQGNPVWERTRFYNSVAEREENDHNQQTFAAVNSITLKYDILKGLSLAGQFGADYQSGYEDRYEAQTNWSGMNSSSEGDPIPIGYSTRGHSNYLTWSSISRLDYDRTFGKHTIKTFLAFEANSKEYKSLEATGNDFVNDHIKEVGYAINRKGSSGSGTTRSASFLGQATYSYDRRYYFLANYRKDGNSNFGDDVRWANFGAVGVSWNIHNEDFFNSRWINILKLKASYGIDGNSRMGNTNARGLYTYGSTINYSGEMGTKLSSSPNPSLTWESTYKTNLGLRIMMFNRLDVEMEVYNNKTVDLINDLDVSYTTGTSSVYRNLGEIRNRGIELSITSENLRGAFEWHTEFNIAHNQNRLLKIYNGISKTNGNYLLREGYDLQTLYLLRWAGVDPRDGHALWYDAQGNITRAYNENNRVPYKSAAPLFAGGLGNLFFYKGISLNVFLTYKIGGYAFSTFGRNVSSDGYNIDADNQSVNQLDRWQKPGDLALSPKPIWKYSTRSTMNSTRYLYNTTHFRLKNVALGYSLPAKWLKRTGISACNVNFIVDNLNVWTPYDKKDRNSYRQSMSGYPMETTYSVGLELSF